MGYRVIYGQHAGAINKPKHNYLRLRTLTAACLLFFALLVRTRWETGADRLRDAFLPGELSAVQQAFSELVEDLRAGEGVQEAMTAFCMEILRETD